MGAEEQGPAHARRIIVILGFLTVIAPFATDMYLGSFPTLVKVFATTPGLVQATLSAFIIGVASGQVIWGPLADRFGRRGPLIVGLGLYVASSLAILAAPSIESVILLRFLQAFGCCAGMVIGRAVVRDLFEGRRMASALSLMMIILSVGPILAPVLGGYIFAATGWRGNFVFLALVGAACLLSLVFGIPETLAPDQRRPANPRAVLATYGGLLREPGFLLPALCGSAAISALFTYISGSPAVFMEQHGVSAQNFGWLFGINAVSSVLAAQLNRMLLKRTTPQRILLGAVAAHVAAGFWLLFVARGHSLMALMVPLWIAVGSFPLISANASAIAMGPTQGRAGSASSLLGVMQWGFASVVSLLVGLLHNGTAWPMAVIIAGCGAVAAATFWLGPRKLLGHGD